MYFVSELYKEKICFKMQVCEIDLIFKNELISEYKKN